MGNSMASSSVRATCAKIEAGGDFFDFGWINRADINLVATRLKSWRKMYIAVRKVRIR